MLGQLRGSFRHNLARLARFSGRDSRAQFWPYAIALFIAAMAASMIGGLLMMADMFQRMFRFIAENPDKPLVSPDPKAPPGFETLPPELMPNMEPYLRASLIINLLFVLLVAAATVRRLHDRDRSGLWAAIPVSFWTAGSLLALRLGPQYMDLAAVDPQLMMINMLTTLLSWGTLIALIVVLAGEGDRGFNRFGPDPLQR